MSDKQPQDIELRTPDFKSPEDMLNWSGELFIKLFKQSRNIKVDGRIRLLSNYLDVWAKTFTKYQNAEGFQEVLERLENLERERGLKVVSK